MKDFVFIVLAICLIICFMQVMRSSSKLSKIFLAAMVYEGHKTGMSETTFDKVVSCGIYDLVMYHVSLVVKKQIN